MVTTEITVFTKSGGTLTKRISLDAGGKVVSDGSECRMARGSARSVTLESAYALAELIGGMAPNEALTLGRLRANLPDDVNVVRRHELTDTTTSDVIARTGEYLHFAPGEPAWMLLDHDSKGMPADVAIKLKDAGGFWPAVTAVIPGLAGPATVRRRSTSAGLYRSDIRERLPGSANQHIYVLASDGTDIERALKTLHERLWLAEVGYFVVGAAGQLLDRSIVDASVFGPERLVFEGAPIVEPPLAQSREARTPQYAEGDAVNTSIAIPPLTAEEEKHLTNLKIAAAYALKGKADQTRARWADTYARQHGLSREDAMRVVSEAVDYHALAPEFELEFDNLGRHTVAEVLADPEEYVDETLSDPLEGPSYGRCKAKLLARKDGNLIVHSFAHGGINYDLPTLAQKIIAELAALDRIAYDQRRKQAKDQLGIRASTLDDLVDKVRAKRKAAPIKEAVDPAKLAESAKDIVASRDVLALFERDFARIYVGEKCNAKLLYLICTSRLFSRKETMHAAVKGESAIGKSELMNSVAEFMPPESVFKFTALSEKALIYEQRDFAHMILIMAEAQNDKQQTFQDYCLRELMSEGRLRYPVPVKTGGEIKTEVIEKDGPVAFLVSTTRNKLNPENETRLLSLELDDSPSQTGKVMLKVAERLGLNMGAQSINFTAWHDFQRWLASGECRVLILFAPDLAKLIPAKTVRQRRDLAQLLLAIKAHALLHREQRRRSVDGAILATMSDYAAVLAVMGDLLAESAEVKLRKTMPETVAAVQHANAGENGATVREIAKRLKLDRSATYRRLRAAEDAGFIVNEETHKGRPARYSTTGVSLDEGGAEAILPSVDQLSDAVRQRRERANLARNGPETRAQPHKRRASR